LFQSPWFKFQLIEPNSKIYIYEKILDIGLILISFVFNPKDCLKRFKTPGFELKCIESKFKINLFSQPRSFRPKIPLPAHLLLFLSYRQRLAAATATTALASATATPNTSGHLPPHRNKAPFEPLLFPSRTGAAPSIPSRNGKT
jgi:hypothetical protein